MANNASRYTLEQQKMECINKLIVVWLVGQKANMDGIKYWRP